MKTQACILKIITFLVAFEALDGVDHKNYFTKLVGRAMNRTHLGYVLFLGRACVVLMFQTVDSAHS